ncbi:hypothetical protein RHSIM_Rhsim01G0090400 [Rhododendron simsii]|uniref:Uncharacterized protein n=1 Tax=Rhododendron simsii TaxID=118357 RepID=A0A834LWB2_RHOSS|nr:hypothetical protein RHSIM_Rhsim01G0090400 [Rhododendron simsii]
MFQSAEILANFVFVSDGIETSLAHLEVPFNITIFYQVQLLQKRNVAVAIHDERELNVLRIQRNGKHEFWFSKV